MSASAAPARRALVTDERVQKLTLSEKASLLYVGSVPFDGMDVGGRSLPFVVGAVYLTVSILGRVVRGGRRGKRDLPIGRIVPMFLFTVYCTASYFWSLAPDLTIARVTTLFVLLLTSWFLSQDLSRISRAVPFAFIFGSLPVALLVLAAPASLDNRRTANGNANDVALMLLLGVACSLWVSLSCSGKMRFLGLATMPILVIGTVATGSRTAVLGGAAMLLTVTVRFAWKHQWQRVVILLALVALGAWFLPHLPAAMIPDRLSSIEVVLQGGSLSNRTYIWDAILERGFDLTGIGAGASPAYLGEAMGSQVVAHNVFLGVLLDTGLLGVMLFLAILLKAGIHGRLSPYRELLSFMFPVLIASSMALSLEARRSLWFVITLALVMRPREKTETEDS